MSNALGKAQLHSGKPFPSATLGEECPGYLFTRKASSPRAKNRALGEGFPESRPGTRKRVETVGGSRRRSLLLKKILPRVQHSGKTLSSPSAAVQALGEDTLFPEHPAQALGKETFFPECRIPCTRGSHFGFFLFFAFPCKQQSIYITNKKSTVIYHKPHLYISQMTKFVRNSEYITNHTFKSTYYSKFTSSIHKNNSEGGSRRRSSVRCRLGLGRPSLRSWRRSKCE